MSGRFVGDVEPTRHTTPGEAERARRHVAAQAVDAADARLLLAMLGLIPDTTARTRHRDVYGRAVNPR